MLTLDGVVLNCKLYRMEGVGGGRGWRERAGFQINGIDLASLALFLVLFGAFRYQVAGTLIFIVPLTSPEQQL